MDDLEFGEWKFALKVLYIVLCEQEHYVSFGQLYITFLFKNSHRLKKCI